jgi:hypothetical protein
MKFSTRRALAAIVAAACLAIPTAAFAMPYSPPSTTRSDAAQSGGHAGNGAPHDPIVGDDIRSHPGMPGMPKYDPPSKFNRRIDRFLRRGRSAARSEWRLANAAHNLLKLWRHASAPATA